MNNRIWSRIAIVVGVLSVCHTHALAATDPKTDPHYNEVGFFDIHVCNWPDRPPFFLALFSTTRFSEIRRVEVLRPDGTPLGDLDLKRFSVTKKPDKPEKRAFLTQIAIPADRPEGWYSARITLTDGRTYSARDRVEQKVMPRAEGLLPAQGEKLSTPPTTLRWAAVPGASHYQVYVVDLWNDEKEIYRSKVIDTPDVTLPAGLLKPGGLYRWRVNARDVHEHVELGDFNHGSLSAHVEFEVLPSVALVP